MPLFKDSYDTTIGGVMDTKRIAAAIRESLVRDAISSATLGVQQCGDYKPLFITGAFDSEAHIPLFSHPICVTGRGDEKYVCTDLRFFLRKDTPLNNILSGVKNLTEYNFAKSRNILNMLWLSGEVDRLRINMQFAGVVFSAWLSEAVSKTYALDFKDQTTVAIVANFYYQCLFMDKKEPDEEDRQRIALAVTKATSAPSDLVFQITDKIDFIADVNDLCRLIVSSVENVRLRDFNLAMLLTLVKNSWYGLNAKEIISVALEHPPTWMAVVYACLSERTYKTSMIFRVAERVGKRGLSDEFTANYGNVVRSVVTQTGPSLEEQPVVKVGVVHAGLEDDTGRRVINFTDFE